MGLADSKAGLGPIDALPSGGSVFEVGAIELIFGIFHRNVRNSRNSFGLGQRMRIQMNELSVLL